MLKVNLTSFFHAITSVFTFQLAPNVISSILKHDVYVPGKYLLSFSGKIDLYLPLPINYSAERNTRLQFAPATAWQSARELRVAKVRQDSDITVCTHVINVTFVFIDVFLVITLPGPAYLINTWAIFAVQLISNSPEIICGALASLVASDMFRLRTRENARWKSAI